MPTPRTMTPNSLKLFGPGFGVLSAVLTLLSVLIVPAPKAPGTVSASQTPLRNN